VSITFFLSLDHPPRNLTFPPFRFASRGLSPREPPTVKESLPAGFSILAAWYACSEVG
tara:strand:+ start:1176 stop:1349 length:174 start_codon:yes stop_codon:yes gene_type:complete